MTVVHTGVIPRTPQPPVFLQVGVNGGVDFADLLEAEHLRDYAVPGPSVVSQVVFHGTPM